MGVQWQTYTRDLKAIWCITIISAYLTLPRKKNSDPIGFMVGDQYTDEQFS